MEINKYCQMYTHSATATQTIRYTITNNPIRLASCCKRFNNLNNVTQQSAIIKNNKKNMQEFENLGENI